VGDVDHAVELGAVADDSGAEGGAAGAGVGGDFHVVAGQEADERWVTTDAQIANLPYFVSHSDSNFRSSVSRPAS
jgi:hypothetical protein